METAYEVICKEVSNRGRRFPHKHSFVEWCDGLARRHAIDMAPREFYQHVIDLIAVGRLDVFTGRNQVRVRVLDR